MNKVNTIESVQGKGIWSRQRFKITQLFYRIDSP